MEWTTVAHFRTSRHGMDDSYTLWSIKAWNGGQLHTLAHEGIEWTTVTHFGASRPGMDDRYTFWSMKAWNG